MKANLLKAKCVEKSILIADLANALGINIATFYRKMNGTSDFTRNEIQIVKNHLSLTDEEIMAIFFSD